MSGRPATIHADGEGRWIDWRGAPFRLLSTGDQTDNAVTMGVELVDIGDGPSPHVQSREDEGFYVLEGKVEFTVGNETVRLGPGDFINVRLGTAHTVTNVGLDEVKLVLINAPAGFDAYQIEIGKEVDGPFETYDPEEQDPEALAVIASQHGVTIDLDLDGPEFSAIPEVTVRHAGEGAVIDAVGDRYRFLAESADTGGHYALWHATIYPGGGPPLHRHSKEEEAFYVLKGELTFEADGETAVLSAGGFAHLPKGSTHAFKNNGDEPAEALIVVAPAGLEAMFRKTGKAANLDGVPEPPSESELATLKEIAPKYGIELV